MDRDKAGKLEPQTEADERRKRREELEAKLWRRDTERDYFVLQSEFEAEERMKKEAEEFAEWKRKTDRQFAEAKQKKDRDEFRSALLFNVVAYLIIIALVLLAKKC
jgi:Flp pilus assembly protein TadB